MEGRDLKIVFLGTPEFAVESLRALEEGGYRIVAVVTTPDKPAGRGQRMHESDVKRYAQEVGLPVLQPEKLRDEAFLAQLRTLEPDLGIVIAFRMLPEVVWGMPRLGTFNLHASLLPEYRGAAPINRAIMNGETETGVTTFLLNSEIDQGDIIGQTKIPIRLEDNAGTIHDKLMIEGSRLVIDTVERIARGNWTPIRQQHIPAQSLKPAPKIFRDDCRIDWNTPGERIVNLVRGLAPYPGAWTDCVDASGQENGTYKIFDVRFTPSSVTVPAGTLRTDGRTLLEAACADGWIALQELQPAGKRRMKVSELLCGWKEADKYRFTSK